MARSGAHVWGGVSAGCAISICTPFNGYCLDGGWRRSGAVTPNYSRFNVRIKGAVLGPY